jgi:hypothetical protein
MSTQCGIAIKTEKGYETIYVHSDGYPDYMWPMLTENYNSEELAKKLVSMGDASYIAPNLEPREPNTHSFENPDLDICCFYHRDRGEGWDDVAPAPYTKKEMFSCFYYSYIWENGCWNFYKGGRKIYS